MADLVTKILNNQTSIEEVVQWLLTENVTTQKEGVTKIVFARYLLDFLRKHTRLLLVTPDLPNLSPKPSTPKLSNTSTPLQTPRTFSCESTPSDCRSISCISTSSDSRFSTPIHNRSAASNRSRTPFSPSCNCTPGSQNASISSPSMELLERRLTLRENSRTSPKPLQLKDFIVVKEKPKKKKKRVNPIPCDRNETQGNINVAMKSELSDQVTPIKISAETVKRVAPTLCSATNKSPSNQNEVVKLLKREESETCQGEVQNNTKHSDRSTEISFTKEVIAPLDTASVRDEDKVLLEKLASLYSAVITSNYIQDLLKELNYLMSLLTSNMKVDFQENKENAFLINGNEVYLFKSREEGVYFAARVLELQWALLKQLNTATLSILSQNDRLKAFVPQFVDQICNHIKERKCDFQNISIMDREMLSETVKFKMDTDCRPNYVNEQLFYAFKKQRDEFYSLLQEWQEEANKRYSSAEFFKAKYKRLKFILSTSTASTNMYRLADLFVSQILASVFNENKNDKEKSAVDGISASKFDLLNRRFVAPSSSVTGNEKRFSGVQEFFKDFLRTASAENSFFFSHVRDVFVQRIVSLNSVNISGEASVASVRQELYLVCINKLCLLAKFLSLISFLPYQDKDTLPPHLRIPLVEARKHTLPPLDLVGLLKEAIQTGRIPITVPWIVEFMNGIDDTSVQLPCYKVVLAKLQYLLYKIKLPSNKCSFEANLFLVYTDDVKNSIVELKERTEKQMNAEQLKKMALEANNDFTKRFVDECLRTMECVRLLITIYVNSLFNNLSGSTIIKIDDVDGLMNLPITISSEFYVDDIALYQCHAQLNELKLVLEGGKKISYKSITPTTEKTFCDHQTNEIALDMQLEMHFFDNMSHSVKYTVDTVAKTISSHCVSTMRDKVIPELKTQLCEHMKTALMDGNKMDEITDAMLEKFYSILRKAVNEELSTLYKSVESSLMGMLKPEVKEDVCIFNTCVDVTCRKCIEMSYNWIFNYISFDGIVEEVKKSAVDEAARLKSNFARFNEDKRTKKCKTDLIKNDFNTLMTPKSEMITWTSPGPVKILHEFRHRTRIIIANSGVDITHPDAYPLRGEDVTTSDIECLVQDTISCIEQRADLQFIAFRRIMLVSLDMVSMLIFLRPDLVTNTTLQIFDKMWNYRKECKLHLHFEHVLSPRNVEIYSRRSEQEQQNVCRCLETYLCFTLENKIIHTSRLFRQVLKLLQHNWPDEELLKPILVCVKEALKKFCPSNQKIMTAIESVAAFGESEWS